MVFVDDCIFCNIAQKKIQSSVVYEDENNIAILDIHPANKGHTLVIPKSHVVDILSMGDEQTKDLFDAVRRVAHGVKRATNSDAFNIVENNGVSAGQAIPHVHIHIIPRFENDGLSLGVFRQGKYEGNEMLTMRDAIKAKVPEKKVERKEEKIEEKIEKPKNAEKRSPHRTRSIRKEIDIA